MLPSRLELEARASRALGNICTTCLVIDVCFADNDVAVSLIKRGRPRGFLPDAWADDCSPDSRLFCLLGFSESFES